MKKLFRKDKVVAKPEPRDLKAIEQEFNQVTLAIGSAQYQVEVYKQQVLNLCQRAMELNNEGAEAKKLAAEVAKDVANVKA